MRAMDSESVNLRLQSEPGARKSPCRQTVSLASCSCYASFSCVHTVLSPLSSSMSAPSSGCPLQIQHHLALWSLHQLQTGVELPHLCASTASTRVDWSSLDLCILFCLALQPHA